MDTNNLIDEPNRVADVYRNYRPSFVPIEVEKRLDFIEISEDGCCILGSSNLSGRYWKGSLWYFKNPTLAPRKENCTTGIECETSVCVGKFLDGKKTIIIGEDSGAVTVFELITEDDHSVSFEPKESKYHHDNGVLSISVSSDKSRVVTAGMDLTLKVWDIRDLIPAHTFRCAHSHHVTSVMYTPENDPNVLASCGLDGAALLWDTRQPKPATVLLDDPEEGLTALSWLKGGSSMLVVGSAFGAVSLVDIRVCASVIKTNTFQRPIYRLLCIEQSAVAACADSHEVKIFNPLSEDMVIQYVDERHSDFVRGLTYDKASSTLYSCGWDTQVLSHSVNIV